MNIYIPLLKEPHEMSNPFVYTLVDSILECYSDVSFEYDMGFFANSEMAAFDIIHIMWPHFFSRLSISAEVYREKLVKYKEGGGRVVSTCHNLIPHYSTNSLEKELYDITYQESDCIIHLGEHSRQLFLKNYPNAENILIPHHVYDTVYQSIPSRLQSLAELNLSDSHKYIVCMGQFRDDEERKLVKQVGKSLAKTSYYILAPSFYHVKWRRNFFKLIIPLIQKAIIKRKYHIITELKKFVSDDVLVNYMNIADISLIQRCNILNSGNLTLGMLFGNIVVGPSVGNVGFILKQLDNPTFDPNDPSSLLTAVGQAIAMTKGNKGIENRAYALEHFSTRRTAEMYYNCYTQCL